MNQSNKVITNRDRDGERRFPREERVRPVQVYPISNTYTQQLESISQSKDRIDASGAFVTGQTARETATPVNRAIALTIRLAPFSVVWLVLAIGAVAFLRVDESYGFALFSSLTALTYLLMNQQEYKHSTNGLERHRCDAAERLASQKMAYDAAARREITRAYLEHLGGPK